MPVQFGVEAVRSRVSVTDGVLTMTGGGRRVRTILSFADFELAGEVRAQAGTDATGREAVCPARVEVGEQDGDGLADQPAAVDDEAEPAQRQAGVFQIEQFGGGKVNGDLLIMLFPASRLPWPGLMGREIKEPSASIRLCSRRRGSYTPA